MDYEDTDIDDMDVYESEGDEYLDDSEPTKKSKKSKKSADKDLRHVTRRKVEDMLAFRRLREEHGWMDDFDLEFGEVY